MTKTLTQDVFKGAPDWVRSAAVDSDGQRKRIDRKEALNSVMVIMTTTGNDGKKYEMLCLPIEVLNG